MSEPISRLPKRALVTGASGFIGSRLCAKLVGSGVEVHGVSRTERQSTDMQWWVCDVSTDDLLPVVQGARPDVIFHLAGHVSGSRELENVVPTLGTNFMSTVKLLLAAAETGCQRVLLAGSLEEPEAGSDDAPVSPYAAAKHAATSYARMFNRLYHVPVVTLRLFMVYGPGQRDETKLVPYVITSFLRSEAPRLSSGIRPIDWVYVDDVVDAFVAAAMAERVDGEIYDIGSGSLVTIREVVEEIALQMRPDVQPVFGALPDRPFERVRVADVSRAQAELGWEPRTNLRDGLAATIARYGAQVMLVGQAFLA